jgi:Protein of unknown function (DUF3485)
MKRAFFLKSLGARMSTTELTIAPSAVVAERPVAPEGRAKGGVPWGRVLLACAVLAAAGGIRWWQGQEVEHVKEQGQVSPFPLKTLPMKLGAWQVPDQREDTLEPEVVQVTGCVDYIKRHYVDEQTGVGVDVLVMYGPASVAHRPDVCYPGAGYTQIDGPRERTFTVPSSKGGKGNQALFWSLVFAKGEGGAADRQQVFYALRYGGQWTARMDYKRISRVPGLYKIQLTRRVAEHERLDLSNPCELFLEAMLPELEQRISQAH